MTVRNKGKTFRSSCNLLMSPIPPDLLGMSLCYFQILTSVIWLIIIALRVVPIVQTLYGHSNALPDSIFLEWHEMRRFVYCNIV